MNDQSDARSPARRPRVFLVGYYGTNNVGDEAIRLAVERAADRLGVDIVRFATRGPSSDPRAVPVRGAGVWRYLRAVVEADRVVLGGGGILKDEGLRLPVELLLTALWARLLRRPVALLAVGVGPIHRRIGRWLVAATSRLATIRTVRDEASAVELARLGVARVAVGADPVVTLAERQPPTRAAGEPRRLVVSIRPWYLGEGPERQAARRRLRAAVADAIRIARAAGWQVALVPLYWPRDRDEARQLLHEAELTGAEIVDAPLDWDGLTARVAAADLVIAMRYHAVLCAAMHGRRTIALAYEPKVSALAADLGLTAFDVAMPAQLDGLDARLGAAVADIVGGADEQPQVDPERLAVLRGRAERVLRLALTGENDGV